MYGVCHQVNGGFQPVLLGMQRGQVLPQQGQPIKGGRVKTIPDAGQFYPKGAVNQDFLQPVYLGRTVIAVAAFRYTAGFQQTDLIVPPRVPVESPESCDKS